MKIIAMVRQVLLVPLLVLWAGALSALTLEQIDFYQLENDAAQIRLSFDGVPPEVDTFTIDEPARLTVDLPGVSNALAQRKYSPDFKNAKSVVVLEAQGRTRMIVKMLSLSPYKTYIDGNTLVLAIGGDASNSTYADSIYDQPTSNQLSASDFRSSVTELDFRRGDAGEGNLSITLTDPSIDVDVTKKGKYIVVRLKDTFLSDEQRHNYDVVDFGVPVREFSADQEGRDTLIRIQPEDFSDYLAYQIDGMFVVSVRALENKGEQGIGAADYTGERLSLNFQEIGVRSVLQIIADFVDLNLVASDSVNGSITLRLEDVPWDKALDIVLRTQGLAKRVTDNVMYVAPLKEIASREAVELSSSRRQAELAPLQSEHIRLVYAQAAGIATELRREDVDRNEDGERIERDGLMSSRGSIVVDERTNSLIITDTASSLEGILKFIALLDVPVRQVMIEARIVRATDDFSRALGVRWGGARLEEDGALSGSLDSATDLSGQVASRSADFNNAFQSFVDQGFSTAEAASRAANSLDAFSVNFPDALFVDLGVGGSSASSFAVSYLGSNFNVAAELSALESNGQGEIMSQPKVITGDMQPATIKSGQAFGIQQASASGATSVTFEEAVLELEVTPAITPDDDVFMTLKITQDSISGFISGENNSQIPLIDTTELETQVLISNGETVVLGGIFEVVDITSTIKTPFLGDIPYLGRLFKRTEVNKQKSETLIFITPRIIADTQIK